ncbi:MAG: ATP-binding protein [Bacteroidota bacterium]|nr:ATP-binding protein [Bacteroidota bacterium]
MIKQSDLRGVVEDQQSRLNIGADDLKRNLLGQLPTNLENHALIISGIRRCGKSTLLRQLIKQDEGKVFFINFDTPKLFDFDLNDFELLDSLILESGASSLYFDEIQVVNGWELYVRQKLDQKYRVSITGSNASLLSQELGTKLTGRHISKELFPFSFSEFCRFTQTEPDANAFANYLTKGGFPEYLRSDNPEILSSLLDDILFRDIVVRYGIRDVRSLKRLLIFLISNVSNLFTANKFTQVLGIKSSTTILDYLSFFEQAYLIKLMPRFAYSYRAQIVNPRKIYIIDNGLIGAISASFSFDLGRRLENAVFWSLNQMHNELCYFSEQSFECDFVICQNKQAIELIQVCSELNADNHAREENGLWAAMEFFKLEKGTILTLDQSDIILKNGKRIEVLPVYNYFS